MRQLPAWVWLLVAAGFAATASFMALGWLKNQSKPVAQTVSKVHVVVAKGEIGRATRLTANDLQLETWAQPTRPKGAFDSINEVLDRVTFYPMTPGELIMENKLAPKGTPAGIGAMLSPNKRAMTVKVDEASGVAGFVTPGSPVDVLATVDKGSFDKNPLSKLILQNLKVLGTGQKIENRPGDKPVVVNTVTLEVTPEEGEKLALAAQEGKISLILRSYQDQDQAMTSGVKAQQFFGQFGGNHPARNADEARRTVEVIRGLERNAATF